MRYFNGFGTTWGNIPMNYVTKYLVKNPYKIIRENSLKKT